MAGIFKQVQQGLGQCLVRVMIDGGGAVLKFADKEGIEITVYLEKKELVMIMEEKARFDRLIQHRDALRRKKDG